MTHEELPETDVAGAEQALRHAALLLDVREPEEWAAGHAPQAVHTPLGDLHAGQFPDDRVVVVVCRSGRRSAQATRQLRERGIDAINLDGGMQAWAAAGLPLVTETGGPGTVT